MKDAQLFISMVLFKGNPGAGLLAAKRAGFSSVEFFDQDLSSVHYTASAGKSFLKQFGIDLLDLQLLADFDGAPEKKRNEKRAEALRLLDRAVALKTPMLAVTASTDPEANALTIKEDLMWLVAEASRRGLRLSYEPMSWSTHVYTLPDAWRIIEDMDPEVIGLVVDAYHLFSQYRTAEDLSGIPASRIFAVQLNDACYPVPVKDRKEVARTRRLFPGEGDFPVASLTEKLRESGYRGPIGIEVFNEDYARQPADDVARRAMQSLKSILSQND